MSKIDHKDFCNYMRLKIDSFERNMDKLPKETHKNKTIFIQWFKYFKEWMEIGTYMHSEFYPYGTPSDYEHVMKKLGNKSEEINNIKTSPRPSKDPHMIKEGDNKKSRDRVRELNEKI